MRNGRNISYLRRDCRFWAEDPRRKKMLWGVQRNSKGGGGETEGRGRLLMKMESFCEFLNKMSKKGGGRRTVAPPSLYAYVLLEKSALFSIEEAKRKKPSYMRDATSSSIGA